MVKTMLSILVDPYMVVGFGRDANETEEVIRVEVRLSESLAVNATVSIATYNSEACKLNYPSVPSMIKNPDYEMGSSANMTFACQLAVTNIKDASSVTSFVFTQFMFSEPSFLRVNTTRSDQYTGSELPPDVIARHALFLEMQISSQSSDQFTLSMTSSTKDCTKYVSVTSDGTNITSLGYPSAYDNNLFCKLMLVSADNKPLQLTVTKIDLAKDNDKVEVVDGGASRASGKTIATLSALDNYKDKGEGGRFYVPSKIQFPAANTTVTGPVNLVMQAPDEHMVKLSLEKAITNDDATMKCYDGDSTSSPVIAQYSKQFDLYPVFSSNDKMLCVASGVGNSTLFIAADSVTDGQGKFSSSAIDSLSLILPVKEAGEADYQFNWIVQPEVNASVYDVIQLVISEVDFPDTDSEISMKVQL
ncbi:hypothetical protein EB796_018910 [Bugula neritina]|uniref:CUB domain-containing protein n=1 Tax=Bugula neritina TaxID=10212 RepID=A0A7J7J967_BUGNE|nr:hypothetical protein EB796_018910 [Bugula neritina]